MKKIIKNFNNLVKRTIFKVQNKTNSNFNISSFNKYLITFIASLFICIFYLLLPVLYDKTWVQTNIESKLLNVFKVNLSTSADISYRILPAPHFLIRDSKILMGDGEKKKSIAEIKDFKVFLDKRNFFNKEKMNIKELDINKANFTLLSSDLKLLKKFNNKKFSNKKIKVNNSKIFFKNNLQEIIAIVKINKTVLFFDDKKLLNFINLKGEVFNTPFKLLFQNDSTKYKKINLSSKPLKLNFFNEFTIKNKLISGENNISFLNSKIITKYEVKDKLIFFKSYNSRLSTSQIDYNGKLSINPFDLNLNINLDNHKISRLLNINPILIEFIKSGLLFNNISIKNSIIVKSNNKNEIFQNAKINLNIVNGEFNLNGTTFTNNKIGLFELNNSNVFLRNSNLILNTDILFTIKDPNALFSFLNTNKQSRKKIRNILINLSYDYLSDEINFNEVKINNKKVSDQLLNTIEGFKDNSLNNLVKSKRLINKLLSIYEG